MPLFGSKKHANEGVTGPGTTGGFGHNDNVNYTGTGSGMGHSQPGGAMNNSNQMGYSGQPELQPGTVGNSMGGPMAAQMGGHGPMPRSQMNADPYTSGGTGPHTLGQNDRAHIPPTNQLDGSHGGLPRGSGGSASGQRLTGKIESAIGSAVGSSALKAKGEMKQHEANAVKMQGAELAEAERLEREALMRRERAVGHAGAHPANSSLGGGHMGQGPAGTGPFNNNM
ncbi:hypothetical protein CVT24_011286 [Panaeolus cyanescens]|uniref:CsbD-like domain-containing protein n=1 Tax=Panaeolus cyanescens TaxID=181874 RepID=A0A409YUT9_9AGAR|nr:hypothetical protein CVT24_011286 [Panaeolus cyanescens]